MNNGKEGPMKGRQYVNDIRRGKEDERMAFHHSL